MRLRVTNAQFGILETPLASQDLQFHLFGTWLSLELTDRWAREPGGAALIPKRAFALHIGDVLVDNKLLCFRSETRTGRQPLPSIGQESILLSMPPLLPFEPWALPLGALFWAEDGRISASQTWEAGVGLNRWQTLEDLWYDLVL